MYHTHMKDEKLSPKLRCGPGCKGKNRHCSCCHRTKNKKELKIRTNRQTRRSYKQKTPDGLSDTI